MSYHLLEDKTRVARTKHRCIWCGESIAIGDRYSAESSIYDGHFQNHHWHLECRVDASKCWDSGDDEEFTPYSAPRPPSAATLEYQSWDCAAVAQGRLP